VKVFIMCNTDQFHQTKCNQNLIAHQGLVLKSQPLLLLRLSVHALDHQRGSLLVDSVSHLIKVLIYG
jgi:hypothetical protein